MEYLSATENGLPLNPNNWFVPLCAKCSSKVFHHHLLMCWYLKVQVSMWNSVRSLGNTKRLPVLGLYRPSKGLSIIEGAHLSSDRDVFLWELYQGIFSSPPSLIDLSEMSYKKTYYPLPSWCTRSLLGDGKRRNNGIYRWVAPKAREKWDQKTNSQDQDRPWLWEKKEHFWVLRLDMWKAL